MSKNLIDGFHYFKGLTGEELMADEPLMLEVQVTDINVLREQVSNLIDEEMPQSGEFIKSLLEKCARKRRQYNHDNSTFIREQHPFFLELLGMLLETEESHIGDGLLFAYYGLHLTDQLENVEYWVLDTIRDMNDSLGLWWEGDL